jgi:hypothetical protein
MERKNDKIYIKYICPKCKKNFGNHKYQYINHVNRKNPCIILLNDNAIINNPDNNTQNNDILNICEEIKTKNITTDELKNSNVMFNLIEKLDLLVKQNEELKTKQDFILKQNEEFKEDIKKLKEDNEKIKNQLVISNENNKSKTNINIGEANTNININIQLNNFGSIDYNSLDKKLFIDPILNQIGKQIFLKMIKNIYINPELPQNHNLVITDKNRGYVKKYIDGKWETDDLKLINLLVNEIVEHSKVIYGELKDRYDNNNKIKNKLNIAKKYIDLCDIEFLAELEENEEDEDNKQKIKRCKEFYEMVYKSTINLFHDNKELLAKVKNIK